MSTHLETAKAAMRAANAILAAYDRGKPGIPEGYLADTLRMVLNAVDPVINPLNSIEVRPLSGARRQS